MVSRDPFQTVCLPPKLCPLRDVGEWLARCEMTPDPLSVATGSLGFARCDVPLSEPMGTLASWTASGGPGNLEFRHRHIR